MRRRKLKNFVARNANPKPDSNRDQEHELHVARCLASAFIAQSHCIGLDYAHKNDAPMRVGSFWANIARRVIAHM